MYHFCSQITPHLITRQFFHRAFHVLEHFKRWWLFKTKNIKVQEKPSKFFSQLFFGVWYGKLNLIFLKMVKKYLRKYRHLLLPSVSVPSMILLKWEIKLLGLTSHRMPLIQFWHSRISSIRVKGTYSFRGTVILMLFAILWV